MPRTECIVARLAINLKSHENKGSKYISMCSKELVFFSNLDKSVLSNHLHDQFFDSVWKLCCSQGVINGFNFSDIKHVSYLPFENICLLATSQVNSVTDLPSHLR